MSAPNAKPDLSNATPAEVREALQNAAVGLVHRERGAMAAMTAIDQWLAALAKDQPGWTPKGAQDKPAEAPDE